MAEVMERRGRVKRSCSETDSAGPGDCTGKGRSKHDQNFRPGQPDESAEKPSV